MDVFSDVLSAITEPDMLARQNMIDQPAPIAQPSMIAQPFYKVRLARDDRSSVFEGPLDLLLFFIKRDELDIYDIPITRITREFLEYLRLMAALDLEIAGEFIVVAAELCQIKAKMLLPREERVDGVEEDDPRTDLVRRLLEYRRFKEMSEELLTMSEEQRKSGISGNTTLPMSVKAHRRKKKIC